MPTLHQTIVRNLYPFGSIRPVLFGPLQGFRYQVEPGMGFTYSMGDDAANFRFLQKKIRSGMTVFDIGANRGQMMLLFARCVGASGKVISFEPMVELARCTERNAMLNNLIQVKVVPAAASDRDGTAVFAFSPAHSTQGKLVEQEKTYQVAGAENIEVRTLRLDTFIDSAHTVPDVMKIDVEGAAAAVLRGAAKLLDSASPAIYIELHGPEEQIGVRDELLARGYVAETLQGEQVLDPTAVWHNTLWCYKRTALQ